MSGIVEELYLPLIPSFYNLIFKAPLLMVKLTKSLHNRELLFLRDKQSGFQCQFNRSTRNNNG
ncbi:MAG: hypothetical protein C0507_18225 [Cyanobacteria bacterium PR.3.49]|nr:hypothetical protein [Cyanobacteria bacterium PR.3.49]